MASSTFNMHPFQLINNVRLKFLSLDCIAAARSRSAPASNREILTPRLETLAIVYRIIATQLINNADAAQTLEKMRNVLQKIDEEIDALNKKRNSAEGDPEQVALAAALDKLEFKKQAISGAIAKREEKGDENE